MLTTQSLAPAALFKRLVADPVSRREKVGYLVAFAILVAARLPFVVLDGRLWAEEGVVYFRNAWNLPWFRALFAVHADYLNLAASVASVLAVHLASIIYVPYVTTGFALLLQLCPVIVLVTCRLPWLRWRPALVAAILLVLLPPLSGEVWLNSITSQFHLMVAVALILAVPTEGGKLGVFYGVLLAAGPLSGPGSTFLTPLFVLRALLAGSTERFLQALIICIASMIQLAIYAAHPEAARHFALNLPRLLTALYVHNLVLPLRGIGEARAIAGPIVAHVNAGHWPAFPIVASVLALVALGCAAARHYRSGAAWLFAAGVLMAILSYPAAMGGSAAMITVDYGMRYVFPPTVLLALTLLAVASASKGFGGVVAGALVAWLLVVGVRDYSSVPAEMRQGPSWRAEVAAWRASPSHILKVWPDNGPWVVTLDPGRHRG